MAKAVSKKKTVKKAAPKKAAVKKSVVKKKSTTKKAAVSTKKESSVKVEKKETFFSKILPNREQNLYVLVYLLSIVVLLVSGVLFYTTQLLLVTDEQNTLLQDELNFYTSTPEFTIYRYNFEEFSKAIKRDITSIIDVQKYMSEKEFEDINSYDFKLTGKKPNTICGQDPIRDTEVCRDIEINVDLEREKQIEVIVSNRISE